MLYKVSDKYFEDSSVAKLCAIIENEKVEQVEFKVSDSKFVEEHPIIFQTKANYYITLNNIVSYSHLFFHLYATCFDSEEKEMFQKIYDIAQDENPDYIKLTLNQILGNIHDGVHILDNMDYTDERDLILEILATMFRNRLFIGVGWKTSEESDITKYTYLTPEDCASNSRFNGVDSDYIDFKAVSSAGDFLLEAYCEELFEVETIFNQIRKGKL